MAEVAAKELIAYDSMKDQVEREVIAFLDRAGLGVDYYPLPRISFEKNTTMISFPLPALGDAVLSRFISLIKSQLENVRVHSFGDGY